MDAVFQQGQVTTLYIRGQIPWEQVRHVRRGDEVFVEGHVDSVRQGKATAGEQGIKIRELLHHDEVIGQVEGHCILVRAGRFECRSSHRPTRKRLA